MAAFNKFNCFVQDVANALHDMKTGTVQVYKVYLTNALPAATNTVYNVPADLASGNGYATGERRSARLRIADPAHSSPWCDEPGMDGAGVDRPVSICRPLTRPLQQAFDRLVGIRHGPGAHQRQHVHGCPRPDQRCSDDYLTWQHF